MTGEKQVKGLSRVCVFLTLCVCHLSAQVPTIGELSAFFPSTGLLEGQWHRLQFVADRTKTLEVDGAWFSGNTRVQVYRGYGSNGAVSGDVQQWLLFLSGRTPQGEIAFRVVSMPFAKCLDSLASGSGSLNIVPCNSAPSQAWMLRSDPSTGGFWLVSFFSGLALQASSLSDGAAVFLAPVSNQPLQKFIIANTDVRRPLQSKNLAEFQDYHLVSRAFPGRVVAASWFSNGATVVTKTPSPGCLDRWRFVPFYAYDDYFTGFAQPEISALLSLKPSSFDFCRPAAAAEIGYSYMGLPNMPITMWNFYRGVNQGWQVVASRNEGFVHIVNAVFGMVLQANGNGEWTTVTQANFTGAPNQEFRFVPQSMFP